MPGSIGSKRQGPVAKGKRMAGRMGVEQVTVKNLEIIEVAPEKNQIAIKGAVPGARGSLLVIRAQGEMTYRMPEVGKGQAPKQEEATAVSAS